MENKYFERGELYLKCNNPKAKVKVKLGEGTDGCVWRTSENRAIKVFAENLEKNYQDELECYRRLEAAGIKQINQMAVPLLLGFDDSLLVIEMTIVQKPYLLDFGKVYIDRPPPYEFDKQMTANRRAEIADLFEENAPDVHAILHDLKYRFGIYYVDPKPANIRFE